MSEGYPLEGKFTDFSARFKALISGFAHETPALGPDKAKENFGQGLNTLITDVGAEISKIEKLKYGLKQKNYADFSAEGGKERRIEDEPDGDEDAHEKVSRERKGKRRIRIPK